MEKSSWNKEVETQLKGERKKTKIDEQQQGMDRETT